ncbi:MAG: O-antigen ligase domain-containing protein [Methylococcales bacterium]|nr:O-antigen ligase domain-containing protein [Methylococcales bacterium]
MGTYVVILFLVSIYFSTALAIVLSAVIALLWAVSGQYKQIADTLKNCPVALWSLLLFACFLVGSYHGDAPRSDAVAMLKKYRELLFIPLLLPFLAEERTNRWAWNAFIIASVVTLIGSQMMSIKLFCLESQCLPYFKSYITHGILIAFFAFFITHKAVDSKGTTRILYFATLLLCLYNLFFIADGRLGKLIFIALMLLFATQRFSKKGVLLAVVVMTVLLAGFINFSDKAARIKGGVASVSAYLHAHPEQSEQSMGDRLTFWKYSLKLIAEKPLFGQGTGNFSKSYQRVSGQEANNPHNEFFLIGTQLGAVGLLFYLGFLGSQAVYAKTLPAHDKWLAQGVLVTLIVTSSLNSPLLDHTEGHWFTMMIALCFAARIQAERVDSLLATQCANH